MDEYDPMNILCDGCERIIYGSTGAKKFEVKYPMGNNRYFCEPCLYGSNDQQQRGYQSDN